MTWQVRRDHPGSSRTQRLRFSQGEACLNFKELLDALVAEETLRERVLHAMSTAPYVAFRWETPPLAMNNQDQPFACLLHDSPDLDVPADPSDFEAYFQSDHDVVSFSNLGADALLVAPCPVSSSANYSHIASFHRSAPQEQQHALWIEVARSAMANLGSDPLWLSTAGGGVDWLHIRLDQRPKYYRHAAWRSWPPAAV